MFSNSVDLLPPFSQNIRNKIMFGDKEPNNDNTLFMTLVALLHKRVPNLKIYNKISFNGFQASYLENLPTDSINFVWFAGCSEDPKDSMPEHKDFPDHDKFFKDKIGQNVWIKTIGENTVCVFCQSLNLSLWHMIQIFIPVYFRSLFEKEPYTEHEQALFLSMSKTSDTLYKKEMQTLLEDSGLKRFLLSSELFGFERCVRKKKYDDAVEQFNRCINNMDSLLDRYRQECENKNTAEALVRGLKQEMDETAENTEFEEYLYDNKLLSDIRVDGSKISFIVKTFVDPYLPDDWDSLSQRGSIFRNHPDAGNCLDDEENLKLLLDAIFSRNHCLKLRICGVITLDYLGSYVSSTRNFNFTTHDPSMKNYVPNAHLYVHNCFGRNMDDILMQLRENDLIGAVECCINVVRRMNVSEGPSFDPFVNMLKKNKGKCIVTEDGREMTCKEAVDYLKEKKNETVSDGTGEADVA